MPMIAIVIPLGEVPGLGGGGPVDPGYGRPDRPAWGGPVDPGWGVRPPVDPGYGRPDIGARPPVDPSWGVTPPVDPGYGHGGGPRPGHDLPQAPVRPGQLPTMPGPDNSLPLPPGSTAPPGQVYPPLTELHTKTAVLAWLPGYGYRWIVLGGSPATPGTPLPPTAQPKA